MIPEPTTPAVLETIADGMASVVVPEVTEPAAQLAMGMALQVLRTAAMRSGNELAWMREEANAIEDVAKRLLAEVEGGGTALAAALDVYTAQRTDSLYLADARADYERASEVLSCAAELAYSAGTSEHRMAVHRLFEQRMAHENAITGGYQAVGRT